MTKLFPTILIVLDLCAAITYLHGNDWRHAGYWACAGGITFFATY